MTLPTYTHEKRRHLKFGEKTQTFSVKLPLGTIEKIKERQLDMGRTIYDMVERNLNPYSVGTPAKDDIVFTLVNKLVKLMINKEVTAPDGFFTPTEEAALLKVAREE